MEETYLESEDNLELETDADVEENYKKLYEYTSSYSMDSFNLFKNDLLNYKRQNSVKTKETLTKFHNGDYSELNDFLCENMGLCIYFAKKYVGMVDDIWELNDLVQEGFFGLREAALRYDPENIENATFSTYASFWIKQKIQRFIDDKTRCIRIPVNQMAKIRKINNNISNRGCTLEEACDISGMTASDYYKLYSILYINSLEYSVLSEDGNTEELINFIQDTNTNIEKDYETADTFDGMYQIMKTRLSKREFEIIARRIGLFGLQAETLDTIGQSLGLTRERIRQIEKKAYEKLQTPIKRYIA